MVVVQGHIDVFKSYSNAQLRKRYWIFTFLSLPAIVPLGQLSLRIATILHLPIRWILKPTLFQTFCGGESLEECENVINTLHHSGIKSIPDYSVEAQETESAFEHAKEEILKIIAFVHAHPATAFAVFKVSALARTSLLEKINENIPLSLAEEIEWNQVRERVSHLCATACQQKVKILIDAEESWTQNTIDALAYEMMLRFNTDQAVVFNTVQLYRKDRIRYIEQTHQRAKHDQINLGFKLVRGAYMEKEAERAIRLHKENPIHSLKVDTDIHFHKALYYIIEHTDDISVCIGTHNAESCELMIERMNEKKIAPNHPSIWFAQLYGMGDRISYSLAKRGYHVAKYLPYGPVNQTIPYLIRRAQENSSVLGQTSQELLLIKEEMRRRKL